MALHIDSGLPENRNEVLGLRIFKPRLNTLRCDAAHIRDCGQFLKRGRSEGIQRTEMAGQDQCRLLPHLPDAKGTEQFGEVILLGLLNGRNQVLRGFFAHAL